MALATCTASSAVHIRIFDSEMDQTSSRKIQTHLFVHTHTQTCTVAEVPVRTIRTSSGTSEEATQLPSLATKTLHTVSRTKPPSPDPLRPEFPNLMVNLYSRSRTMDLISSTAFERCVTPNYIHSRPLTLTDKGLSRLTLEEVATVIAIATGSPSSTGTSERPESGIPISLPA